MVLEIIAAAVLIAFGLLSIFFSVSEGEKDETLMIILAIGALSLLAGLWIILTKITLMLLLKRIAGIIFAFVGVFLVFGFPDIQDYQSFNMSKAGIFIGLIILVVGIYFMFF